MNYRGTVTSAGQDLHCGSLAWGANQRQKSWQEVEVTQVDVIGKNI